MNWDDAYKKFLNLQNKRNRLEGKRQSLDSERIRILDQANRAQERIQASDFVKELLDNLQKKEHERAVGAYEQLLGAFVSDVLPGEREIVMDLHTDRGNPALDMYIKKGENSPLEDAWLGTGGSVTNLLSTGLRVIALLRSGKRRFLVLDESDCWIKPDLIPRYAQVVHQMSKDLGVQVLMISHHDESLFSNHILHRLKMSQLKGGLINVEWSPSSSIPTWDEEQSGIRSITLKNFQSHEHTMINLSPQVTLLQGDNDIGKSAVVNALRSVFDGDSNDTLIKHHQKSASVMLDLGPDNILSWTRFRKGKVKVSYKLINKDDMSVIHASDGVKVPEWVDEQIKIGKIEGLDVQIGQQQDPVFLLNQPASQRAKALAIGQESGHVNTMMAFEKSEVQEAKSIFKASEKMLEQIRQQLYVLDNLGDDRYKDFEDYKDESIKKDKEKNRALSILSKWSMAINHLSINKKREDKNLQIPNIKSNKAKELLQYWSYCEKKFNILDDIDKISLKNIPDIKSSNYRYLYDRWNYFLDEYHILNKISTVDVPKNPPIPQSNKVYDIWYRWNKNNQIIQILNDLKHSDIKIPKLQSNYIENINIKISKWIENKNSLENNNKQIEHVLIEIKNINNEIKEKFPICPTCNRTWNHKH